MDNHKKARNKLIKFLSPILNLSLFIKMGLVIFICVSVNSIISLYLYSKLKQVYSIDDMEPFRNYETLSQIALRKINWIIEGQQIEDFDTMPRLKELHQLLAVGLEGGTVLDFSGETLIRELSFDKPDPKSIPKEILLNARTLTQKLLDNPDLVTSNSTQGKQILEKLRGFMISLQRWSLKQQTNYKSALFENISNISSQIWLILIALVIFLIWGALAFLFMVIRPINNVIEKIKRLSSGRDDPEDEECLDNYYSEDEIGQLVQSVNELVKSYRKLATFKHLIEEDESIEDVYERLAQVFKDEIKLPAFVIYQVSNSQNLMSIMYKYPEELETNPAKLADASVCRAKRTGHVVSSLGIPEVCKVFMWPNEANHYCIPMVSAGECVGVVQFILPFGKAVRIQKGIRQKLKLAERYINESIPVLEKRYAQSLKEQTFKDPLTGLFNRRFLDNILENLVAGIIRRQTVLGILMADLDFFKSINDRYGHDIGDTVLTEVAHLIKTNIRKSDLAVRYGGEEFLVLLVDIKEGETEMVAEKLRATVEQYKIKIPSGTIQRTISIGVSEFPVDSNEIWKAIKFADVALYKAKEMGRNRVVRFKEDMWQEEDY